MEILLTLPPHFAGYVRQHTPDFPSVSAVYSDPEGRKLGSGGGTVNVLWKHGITPSGMAVLPDTPSSRPRIIIHADGESRRLPAYAATGKSFLPFPVFKWGRGQRIDQTLFDVQRPLLENILGRAHERQRTLVASGDSLVWTDAFTDAIPDADVVCIGVWAGPETARNHGVFVVSRQDPSHLEYMLQKPSVQELQSLTQNSLYLLDSGIWLLSDRAVAFLYRQTGWNSRNGGFKNGLPGYYDLYTDFGSRLGENAAKRVALSVKIVAPGQAEFYHFGSNSDLLRSTRALHERVVDQRGIWHKKIKPSPDIFVQNSATGVRFSSENKSIWIENSSIPDSWTLNERHILTGIPANDWNIEIPAGICLDVIPAGDKKWCIRPYGFDDCFRGNFSDPATMWMNRPVSRWFGDRGFSGDNLKQFSGLDLFECRLFPVVDAQELTGECASWLTDTGSPKDSEGKRAAWWLACQRLSAREIIGQANHIRMAGQRKENLACSLSALAANKHQSVFYQLDLDHLAAMYRANRLSLPDMPDAGADVMTRVHDLMFRSVSLRDRSPKASGELEREAFGMLREGMIGHLHHRRVQPVLKAQTDQILWGRSPVRLDLAGGWTDTPPYCLLNGGSVVNMAVELNGQPPIQVYIRPVAKNEIVIRSIDLGVVEVVRTYEDLEQVTRVGSAFSIPKAALMLAGFHPRFSSGSYGKMADQLAEFGGGLDISLMVAVPKGSGLGTSSILAATLLGSLSEICSLGWDRHEMAYRTLLLEQLLTTGGGWQDQIGGIFEGIKLIESNAGLDQRPRLSWAPDQLFTHGDTRPLILLYYTGITRVAKHILTDIVRGMFLNAAGHLSALSEMKHHARVTYEAIMHHDWSGLTEAVGRSWLLNNRLDAGTNPPEVDRIIQQIKDYAASYKLLGAGGGGYLMIFAKDADAVLRIREILTKHPPNTGARFVDWRLSPTGLEITKS